MDEAEFDRATRPQMNALRGAAMRYTRNPTEADDLVQETMTRAWRFRASFEPGSNMQAWIHTILRNTFINGYHRRGRERQFRRELVLDARSVGPTLAVGNTTRPPGPEEAATSRQMRDAIRRALDQLPENHRRAVMLADLEGISYKRIAEIMGCPIGTVMSRIHRGRKAMRAQLYRDLEGTAELIELAGHDR